MTRAEAARERRDILMKLPPAERRALLARMSEHQRKTLRRYWEIWAHEGQTPPLGCWHTWMIMAGRGYGKTRAGAEWVRLTARQDVHVLAPSALGDDSPPVHIEARRVDAMPQQAAVAGDGVDRVAVTADDVRELVPSTAPDHLASADIGECKACVAQFVAQRLLIGLL